jgi:alkanesulfonate monooxygenase SsuD/methylene tetrahydromethanopterin reductase-like flavin-dependent oxidoreductase (luciferase family)
VSAASPRTAGPVHLAVALDGAGWHPAAWREPDARPAELFTAGYWADLVREAEHGRLDFVTFDDALRLQSARDDGPDGRTGQVRGRLDAVLTAARVAPLTGNVGLVPTVIVTHTEPFHISKAIATLDYASLGRAGLQFRISGRPDETAHFGRRTPPPERHLASELLDETADYVEVVRRLWDSWEDDAEIRDVAAGRFIDRGKLHYIDFSGPFFSVKGPSITPRPPQGQPVVTALAHAGPVYRLAAMSADVVYVTPQDAAQAAAIAAEVRAAQNDAGRAGEPLHSFADLVVFLDTDAGAAASRKARLDDRAGGGYRSDAHVFTGTPSQLAGLLAEWHRAGMTGFRLRPGAIPHDLVAVTRGLVPELRDRGLFRRAYEAGTLRGLLGLPRPASRYGRSADRGGTVPA